jgi:ribosome-associated heat shock protein Hsp15
MATDRATPNSFIPEGSPSGCNVRRAILERVTGALVTDETRVDRWLCAVRLVKTRPLATRLCEGGHVLVNGSPAKPSTRIRAGDRVEAFIADRQRNVEVVRPIESRVGAAVAATCYVDHSPPIVREAGPEITLIRGEGRPSKRLRRELERLRRAADA